MNVQRSFLPRDAVLPIAALASASLACTALVGARMLWTQSLRYGFLVWNLALAWMPLVFALLARGAYREGARPGWRFYAAAGAWLLFFPNAPYIFTDVIHPAAGVPRHFWPDLVLVLLGAVTGWILGFVSLYLMQSVVSRMLGRWPSWLFIAGVAVLGGVGTYMGRFLRLNSWDAVLAPARLLEELTHWAASSAANPTHVAFPALFGAFLFLSYLMLYALTRLPQILPDTDSRSDA